MTAREKRVIEAAKAWHEARKNASNWNTTTEMQKRQLDVHLTEGDLELAVLYLAREQ